MIEFVANWAMYAYLSTLGILAVISALFDWW